MPPKALTVPREYSPLSSTLSCLEHLDLSGNVTEISKHAISLGGFSEVFRGRCLVAGRGEVEVAIKRLRFHAHSTDWKKLFDQEIYVWTKINHPNVLPLLGFAICNDTGYPLLISEWMPLGSASKYLRDFPDTTMMEVAQMAHDAASGLAYLHEIEVIHFDVKADNIVISQAKKALVCDLGCARKNDASRSMGRLSATTKGTCTFWAPELIERDASGFQSKATDVWAFGMVVFELMCREVPYKGLSQIQFFQAIATGTLPRFPLVVEGIESKEDRRVRESLQSTCRMCWILDPKKRPTMQVIKEELKSIVSRCTVPSDALMSEGEHACASIAERSSGIYDTALSTRSSADEQFAFGRESAGPEAKTALVGFFQEAREAMKPTSSPSDSLEIPPEDVDGHKSKSLISDAVLEVDSELMATENPSRPHMDITRAILDALQSRTEHLRASIEDGKIASPAGVRAELGGRAARKSADEEEETDIE